MKFLQRIVYFRFLPCSLFFLLGSKSFSQIIQFLPSSVNPCLEVRSGEILLLTEPATQMLFQEKWSVGPGLEVLGSGKVDGQSQFWIRLKSSSLVGPLNPFLSASVCFSYQLASDSCLENRGTEQICTQVYKQFSEADRVQRQQTGLESIQLWSSASSCVGVGEEVQVGVSGFSVFKSDTIEWITRSSTGILNPWGSPTFLSADGSSATFRVSGNYETVEVWCRLGRCNTVAQVNKVFNPQPEPSSIVVSGLPGVVAGTATTPAEVCLPANVQTAFTLSLSPMPTTGSDGLLWLIPEGFTCNPPACNTASVEITALKDGAAASGQILCQVNNGQCGRAVAQLNVIRSLVSGYNSIGVTAKRTVLEPIPPNAQWSSNCFYPDLSYQFTLNKAPFNNTYHWTALPGTQVWVNPTGQGTNQFTAGTPVSPTSGTPPALGISVLNQGPGFATGLNCNPNPVEFNSRFLATNSVLNPNANPPLPGIRIDKNGNSFRIVTDELIPIPEWFANFPCSQTVDAGDFYYEWGFTGTFDPEAPGPDIVSSEPDYAKNVLVFALNPSQTGANVIQYNGGIFLPGTRIYCRIRKTSASPCGTAADNCFYAYLELEI